MSWLPKYIYFMPLIRTGRFKRDRVTLRTGNIIITSLPRVAGCFLYCYSGADCKANAIILLFGEQYEFYLTDFKS